MLYNYENNDRSSFNSPRCMNTRQIAVVNSSFNPPPRNNTQFTQQPRRAPFTLAPLTPSSDDIDD